MYRGGRDTPHADFPQKGLTGNLKYAGGGVMEGRVKPFVELCVP
jgi:hypothetical protein